MDERPKAEEASVEVAPDIGPGRIVKAFGYSMQGLHAAWRTEAAFRQEALAAMVLIPVAIFVPIPVLQRAALVVSVLFVMVVELLNSSLESAIDRIGLERHPLSKRAKDTGSAAVMLAITIAIVTWAAILLPLAWTR
jgi:diacylglycerol kinase (ATP)